MRGLRRCAMAFVPRKRREAAKKNDAKKNQRQVSEISSGNPWERLPAAIMQGTLQQPGLELSRSHAVGMRVNFRIVTISRSEPLRENFSGNLNSFPPGFSSRLCMREKNNYPNKLHAKPVGLPRTGHPFQVAILRVFCTKSKGIAATSRSHIKTPKSVFALLRGFAASRWRKPTSTGKEKA